VTAAGPGDRPSRARRRRAAEADVERLLREYCRLIDDADLDGFALLFAHGTWCGIPGPGAVRQWLQDNVVLHDGRTLTRHRLHGVAIDVAPSGDRASATCGITVTQHLDDGPVLVTRNTYADRFVRLDGRWHFESRRITRREPGDDSRHRRGGDADGQDGEIDDGVPRPGGAAQRDG
jgi:hypothetical protein